MEPVFTQISCATDHDVATGHPLAVVYALDTKGRVWVYWNGRWTQTQNPPSD